MNQKIDPAVNFPVAYADSNRIGKISILYEVLRNGSERPLLRALFSLCTILESYENESGRGETYIVASELFQELHEGEEIPEYRLECAWPDQAFRDPEHEKDCVKAGEFRFKAIRKIIVRVPPAQLSHRAGQPKPH
jgi:hypothetical protein